MFYISMTRQEELLLNKIMTPKFSVAALSAAAALTLYACSSDSQDTADTASAWDKIHEQGTLTVATSGTLYPTSYREQGTDELTGFEVEVVREMAERLELEVEFSEMG